MPPDCALGYLHAASLSDLPPSNQEPRFALASLLTGSVIWGFTWLPLKYFANVGLDGHAVSLTAYVLVALVALPFIWRERGQWRSETHWLIVIGLCFGIANVGLTIALMSGSVVRVMLLFFLLPAWGALGGAVFLNESLDRRRVAAVVLSLAGVFVIVGGVRALEGLPTVADLAAFIAGISYTGAGIANRKARRIPITSRTLSSFVGCAVLAVAGLAVSSPAIPGLSPMIWWLLAGFSFCWLLGAGLLTTYGLTHVQASRAAVFQIVELLVAVVSAVLIGKELLTLSDYAGGALILAATIIEALPRSVQSSLA